MVTTCRSAATACSARGISRATERRGSASSATAPATSPAPRLVGEGDNAAPAPVYQTLYAMDWLQLRFDFDSTAVRRPFDCCYYVVELS